MGCNKKKRKDGDDWWFRFVFSFDEEKRWEYLIGFYKWKVEWKKVVIEEIK